MYVDGFSDMYIGEFSQESTEVPFLQYQLSLPTELPVCVSKHQNAESNSKYFVF